MRILSSCSPNWRFRSHLVKCKIHFSAWGLKQPKQTAAPPLFLNETQEREKWTEMLNNCICPHLENSDMLFNHNVILPVYRDAKCGKIQCQGGANRPVIGTNAVSIETNIPMQEGKRILCRGTHVYLGDDMPDPGLVLTGTKCGDGLVRAGALNTVTINTQIHPLYNRFISTDGNSGVHLLTCNMKVPVHISFPVTWYYWQSYK